MSLDVPTAPTAAAVAVPATSHRRRAVVLLVVAAWNVWVWGVRLLNVLRDPAGFDASLPVHVVLFGSGIAVAAVLGVIGTRMLRESRTGAETGTSA